MFKVNWSQGPYREHEPSSIYYFYPRLKFEVVCLVCWCFPLLKDTHQNKDLSNPKTASITTWDASTLNLAFNRDK